MATEITVQAVGSPVKRSHIVVPLRFDRAVTGAPDAEAPDIDHRGFENDSCRPAGWVATDARGPSFAVQQAKVVKIKVVREDISASAPLVAKLHVGWPNQIELVEPNGTGHRKVPHATIGANGILLVRATTDRAPRRSSDRGTFIGIHLGDQDGPLLAAAEPHVFSPLPLKVSVHVCTIHTGAATTTGTAPQVGGAALDVPRIFNMVRAAWMHAGVDVRLVHTNNRVYTNQGRDDYPVFTPGGSSAASPPAGTEDHVLSRFRQRHHCNVYFTRYMADSLGVGIGAHSVGNDNIQRTGIMVGVEAQVGTSDGSVSSRSGTTANLYQELGNDTTHEIGHFLNLTHAGNVNSPGRNDTYARRQLMHPNNALPTADPTNPNTQPRFADVGYGNNHRGFLVSVKKFSHYANDGEADRVRDRLRQNDNGLYGAS